MIPPRHTPDAVLSWCRDVIYVPTVEGRNLAACVNVALYDRAMQGVT